MAVIYAAGVRTDRMDVVLAAIDAGSAEGYLRIGTAAMALTLVEVPFANPAGAVAGDVLTFDCTPPITGTAVATGTAAAAEIYDSDNNLVVSGLTVGLAAANVILDSVSVTTGQTVTITAGSLTHNTSGV